MHFDWDFLVQKLRKGAKIKEVVLQLLVVFPDQTAPAEKQVLCVCLVLIKLLGSNGQGKVM